MSGTERSDEFYMHRALEQARLAAEAGEVPVGAVVVDADGVLLAAAHNQPITGQDPSAHAEIMAIRQAAQQVGNYRLNGCTLFVTLEPCMMCLGAIIHARVARVVYAAPEPKTGMIVSKANLLDQPWHTFHPQVEGGVLADRSKRLLKDFFSARRQSAQKATNEAVDPTGDLPGLDSTSTDQNSR